MSLCNINIPATASILPVDTRTLPKVLHLPLANQTEGKCLFIKDYYGSSATNPITVSTTAGNFFDSNLIRLTLQSNYGSIKLLSDGQTKWRSIGFFNGAPTPTVSTSVNPLNINPSTLLWLDATDQTTVIRTGSTITEWRDKSGYGRNATGYANPTLTTTNGLSSILLNSSNNFDGSISARSNLTVFALATNNGVTNTYSRLVSLATLGTSDTSSDAFVVPLESPNDKEAIGGQRNTGPIYTTGSGTIQTNSPFIACSLWTNNATEIYINGSNFVAANTTWKTSTFTFANYAIGRAIQPANDGNNPLFVWPGSIGEVIVYGTVLSAAERQQVEGYLAWKWNLQSNLPSYHLYKNYPPISPQTYQTIITRNLEQNLDAASYSIQFGSNWLATNGIFDTLYNRPRIGVAPAGQNTLILNGSNQYAMNQGGTIASTIFSFDVWFNSSLPNATIVSEMKQPGLPNTLSNSAANLQIVNSNVFVGFDAIGTASGKLGLGTVSTNTWNQVSWTYNGSVVSGFLNGNYISSTYLFKSVTSPYSYYALGAGQSNESFGTTVSLKGQLGAFKFYNSTLLASDVSQNFAALAFSRYGYTAFPPAPVPTPTPPPPPFISPLSLSNCILWFDATNSASITLVGGSASNISTWSNLGTQGGQLSINTGYALTGISTINSLNSISFNQAVSMNWTGSIVNQEKTCFFIFKNLNDFALAPVPFLSLFYSLTTNGLQLGVATGGGVYTYALCRNAVWCMVAQNSSNPYYFTSSMLVTYRITTSFGSNFVNLNSQSIPIVDNQLANNFYTGVDTFRVGRTDNGGAFQLGDMIIYNRALSDTEVLLVENYLTSKWSPGGYVTPPPIFPYIWFDASDPTTITYDVGTCNVTSWSNKGTAAVSAASNVTYTPPKTLQTTQNGLNVLSYNTNNNLRIPSLTLSYGDKSIFVVFRQNTTLIAGQGQFFLQAQNGNNFGDFSAFNFYGGSANTTLMAIVNGGYCFPVYGISTQVVSAYQLLSFVPTIYTTPGTNGVWRNGYLIDSNFQCEGGNNTGALGYSVGGTASASTVPNFNYAESKVYLSSFGQDGRQIIEGQLAWKWGIQGNLPPNHPYRYAPPPS